MRRWDGLLDRYIAECEARGLAPGTIAGMRGELERWGVWMKRRRPRRRLEQVDAPVLVAYVRARSAFHSKSTVSGRMSVMRGMGEFLVREGVWPSNPLRWLRGPKLDARMRVPRRIGAEQMEQLWKAAAAQRSRPAARAEAPAAVSAMSPAALTALAIVVPGLGHALLGRTRKAAIFFGVLVGMFALGLWFGGRLFPFQLAEPLVFLAALAEWAVALPRLISAIAGWGRGDVIAITYEYGNTFLIVSGLLNALVALDVFDRATGRKPA